MPDGFDSQQRSTSTLISKRVAARKAGVSPYILRRLIAQGDVLEYRVGGVGYVVADTIDAWMARIHAPAQH